MVGQRIGAFEVIEKLGAGGMGEVYRARDTRLDRDVALKILPPSVATDADRLARFEREAKTLASLNHPNIAQIYGVEHNAIVMELVEGEDLARIITRGPIPLADALPMARQIADGLEAAHEAGIVHRDLKPANIKLRADGTAKVLDFGLAKALGADGSGGAADAMTSPAVTGLGVILGTAAYMAPEQAKGRTVDRRADIWAFGVVLYEMLTGRRAFAGDDASEVLASVLRDSPDLAALPPGTPTSIRRLLRRCLERDLAKRLPSIGAARLEIADAIVGDADAPASAAPSTRRSRLLWPAAAAGVSIIALVLAVSYLHTPAAAPPEPVVFASVVDGLLPNLSVMSPDGRRLLYGVAAPDSGVPELHVRGLSALGDQIVPSSEGARSGISFGAWSPDSRAVAFDLGSTLRRVDLSSGEAITICELPGSQIVIGPGAWAPDGSILFGMRTLDADAVRAMGVWRVKETGGVPTQVTRLAPGESLHMPSSMLPDGRHFLYWAEHAGTTRVGDVRIASIDATPDAPPGPVLVTANGPAVVAPARDGHPAYLLYVTGRTLYAREFNTRTLALEGSSVPVLSSVRPGVSVADDRLVYRLVGGGVRQASELVRVDRAGRTLATIGPAADYGDINRVDATHVAASRTDADGRIHVLIVDIGRQVFTVLSPDSPSDYAAAIARDGLVAYTSAPKGPALDIYVRPASGVGDPRRLVSSDTLKHPNDWSPDGRFLIYDDHVPDRAQDLLIVSRDGGAPVPFLTTPADETFGQFSPDGKWIAYRSSESGRDEVWIRDFAPGRSPAYGAVKVQVSADGGDKPRWSVDGRELFYLRPGGTMVAVPVKTGATVEIGAPVDLFQTRLAGYVPYAVMPDGTFMLNSVVDAPDESPLVVMINWRSALKR